MAEAFGLAAGVLQVASFGAEVGSTLWRCAKKFHNASKELEETANQVETIALSLRRVDALLQDPATKALHTPKLNEDTTAVSNGCHEVFRELDKHVKGFEAKSSFGKMTMLSRTRWLFDSDKLQGLGQALRRYNDVLHLMISVMAIVEGRRAATKDELQALEAHLQVLAISNRDLTQSNKSLTDTIAAISQAPIKSVAAKTDGQHSLPNDHVYGTSENLNFTSFVAIPPVNPSASMPVLHPQPCIEIMRRCIQSVHELVRSMQCALAALHGYEKVGSSDVHGSYARLAASLNELPTSVQCVHCARSIALSQLGLAKKDAAQAGICSCISESLLSPRVQPSPQSMATNLGSSQPQMQTNSPTPHGTSGAQPNFNGVFQSLSVPDEATIEAMIEKLSRAEHFQELSEQQKRQAALRLHHQHQLVAMKHNSRAETPEGINYNYNQENGVVIEQNQHIAAMQQVSIQQQQQQQQQHHHDFYQQQHQRQEQRHSPESVKMHRQQALMKLRSLQQCSLQQQRQQQQPQQQSQRQQLHHHPHTTVSQLSVMAVQQSWLDQQGEVYAAPQNVPEQPLSRHHGQALGAPPRIEGWTSPSTPDSEIQLPNSYYSAATSPRPPHTFGNVTNIDGDGMDSTDYPDDDDDAEIDASCRRESEPSHKRTHLETPQDMDRQVFLQHSSTYPPPATQHARGEMAPPQVVHPGMSSVTADVPSNGAPTSVRPDGMGLLKETSSLASNYGPYGRPASRFIVPIDNIKVEKRFSREMSQQAQLPSVQMSPPDHQSPHSSHLSRHTGYVSSVQGSPTMPNSQQAGQKRSRSDAFPQPISHAPTLPPSKRLNGSDPHRTSVTLESYDSTSGSALGSDETYETSTSNLSAVQALLSRWVDSSAATVLLQDQ